MNVMTGKKEIGFGDYFVVDVALFASNPVHRAIAVCSSTDSDKKKRFTLYSSGYEAARRHVVPEEDLYYFSIVEKIGSANEKPDMFRAPEKKVSYEL